MKKTKNNILFYNLFSECLFFKSGGAKGNRTPDLLNAIQTLSQLSYGPFIKGIYPVNYKKSIVNHKLSRKNYLIIKKYNFSEYSLFIISLVRFLFLYLIYKIDSFIFIKKYNLYLTLWYIEVHGDCTLIKRQGYRVLGIVLSFLNSVSCTQG